MDDAAVEQLDRVIDTAQHFLTALEFLDIEDDAAEVVDISRWAGPGAALWVRSMTAEDRDTYEQSLIRQSQGRGARGGTVEMDLKNARAKLVARCVVNAEHDGVRVFSDADVAAIGRKNAPMVDALYEVASRLSGIRQEDLDEVLEDFGDSPDGDSSGT